MVGSDVGARVEFVGAVVGFLVDTEVGLDGSCVGAADVLVGSAVGDVDGVEVERFKLFSTYSSSSVHVLGYRGYTVLETRHYLNIIP